MSVLSRLRITTTICLLFFLFSNLSHAGENAGNPDCPSCGVSKASEALSTAGSTVIQGSLMTIGASGVLVVESSSAVANGVIIVMKAAVDAVSVTVQLSGEGLQQLALVSGTVIQATAVSTGHLLISAGKIIAFIPNEIGKALIYHARVK